MNVTVLADNTVTTGIPKGLRGEWGFAAAVGDVLFDTGQSSAAVENARILGVTTNPDDIVLSHTHYDHTAGLDKFLDPFNKPTVYCHPDLWSKRFIREPADGKMLQDPIHIGIPYSRAEVETGATIVEHRDPVGVSDGGFALGEIPRTHDDNAVHLREEDGALVDDPVTVAGLRPSTLDDISQSANRGHPVAIACSSGILGQKRAHSRHL